MGTLEDKELKKREVFMKNIKPATLDLLRQEQISWKDFEDFGKAHGINSSERRLLIPRLDTDGLIKHTRAALHNSTAREVGEYSLPRTYDEEILSILLPMILARLEAHEEIQDKRNRKKKLKNAGKANGDFTAN